MEANELRIKNRVNYYIGTSFSQGVISSLGKSKAVIHGTYQSFGGTNGVQSEIKYCNLDGIPLTEEWLIKFGFKKRGDGDFDLLECSEVDIVISGQFDGWKCDGIWFSVNRLEYVHQLQNLYHALTGTELQ